MTDKHKDFSTAKKVLYSIMPLLIFLLFFIGAEISFRILMKNEKYDPYLNIYSPVSIFSKIEINGELFYKVTHQQAYYDRNTSFLATKPENTVRIFCLGGSASAGWPHPPEEIYSEYLKEALKASISDKNIEIYNVSGHGYASYRLRLIFNDILRFDPDLLIIYSGNNEFLEKRRYLDSRIHDFLWNHSYIIKNVSSYFRSWYYPETTISGRGQKADVRSKVERYVKNLRKDPIQFERAKEHFEFSIRYMLKESNKQSVPVILLTVPVNLKDWRPNVSYINLKGESYQDWKHVYDEGRKKIMEDSYDDSITNFKKAIQLEPLHAESYYYLGKAYEKQKNYNLALRYYMQAKDLDYNPFRALSSFNNTIRLLAKQNKNTFLIDMESIFIHESDNGIPGFDLFLDYVHPTKRGNLLIANKIFEKILSEKILGLKPSVSEFPLPEYIGKTYEDKKDIKLQKDLIWLFVMMHQYESIVVKASDALNLLKSGDYIISNISKKHEFDKNEYELYLNETLKIFSDYLLMERNELSGKDFDPQYKEKLQNNIRTYFFSRFYNNKSGKRKIN